MTFIVSSFHIGDPRTRANILDIAFICFNQRSIQLASIVWNQPNRTPTRVDEIITVHSCYSSSTFWFFVCVCGCCCYWERNKFERQRTCKHDNGVCRTKCNTMAVMSSETDNVYDCHKRYKYTFFFVRFIFWEINFMQQPEANRKINYRKQTLIAY